MTDQEKYQETLEQVYFLTRDLNERQKQEEETFAILSDLSALISTFYTSLGTLEGKRKINAQNTIKTLQRVFNQIGSTYIQELYWRKKCATYEKSLLNASERIEELAKEIEIMNNLNNFAI